VDLAGLPVLVANGARDPMIPRRRTVLLEEQLRDRGAVVTDVPHAGGHQLEPGTLRRTADWLASLPGR
jgi:phospholipase/carboxylesterase